MARYTQSELDQAALDDLRCDAMAAERQSLSGPFYPEKGITADSLRAYARKCREQIAACSKGGARRAEIA